MTRRWIKSLRDHHVDYCSRAGATEWAHQEAEISVEHIAYLLMICLFIYLFVYQESHEILRDVNEAIVQAAHNIGACYGIRNVHRSCSNVVRWLREKD